MTDKKPSENRTATQRIEDLENAVMSLFQVNDNLTKDAMLLKDAIKLLDNKLNSVIKASTAGEALSDDVISRIMVENNCEELENKVKNMVTQGFLVPEEQVSDNSFVVGSELADDDKVVNPRLQFALKAISLEFQEKIKGSKLGDVILLQEGKLRFKVLQSYTIQDPSIPKTSALQAVPTAEQAPEAPAQVAQS